MSHQPPLTRTSRIAVIAPASSPPDPQRYVDGLAALRDRGLHVEAPEEIVPLGYLAGPDELRLEQLNAALVRDDLDAIFCARGGYGVMRLLAEVDYDAARNTPKPIVGYSDITALQLALLARAGVRSIAGPMIAPDWSRMDPFTEESFWDVAGGGGPIEVYNPSQMAMGSIQDGVHEGPLLGGNLSMVVTLLGTSYMPELDGAILFLEEVGEPPYRIDRLLAQLHLSGVLERIGGMLFGAFTDCVPLPDRPSLEIRDIVNHYARYVDGPVAGGLAFGHRRPHVSLPIGSRARLYSENRRATLTLTEPITEVLAAPA